ncbi:MAG: thiamine diphosphokinase [Spirochaetaceae bacterium]|nr:thiamine diphosphokinase [Spirochaetaceae bacterium]
MMRGIVFIGGAGPGAELSGSLVCGADLIVAADSGLIAAENAGVRPHWILGDMDSLGDPRRLDRYAPERVLRHPPDKDDTDTELALRFLWDQGCDETWIIGGGGGRLDHLFAIRSLFERQPCPDRWLTAEDDIRCVSGEASFEALPDRMVSVFPLGEGPWEAKSRGLRWPLEGLPWSRGFFGISNTAPGGSFSIKAEQGRFMVMLPLPRCWAGSPPASPFDGG